MYVEILDLRNIMHLKSTNFATKVEHNKSHAMSHAYKQGSSIRADVCLFSVLTNEDKSGISERKIMLCVLITAPSIIDIICRLL